MASVEQPKKVSITNFLAKFILGIGVKVLIYLLTGFDISVVFPISFSSFILLGLAGTPIPVSLTQWNMLLLDRL